MTGTWVEEWLVDGKRIKDENLGEYGGEPERCINCGDWFVMSEATVCGVCHRKMMVCCLVFEQILGLPKWYPELVILPDYSGYTFNEAEMRKWRVA